MNDQKIEPNLNAPTMSRRENEERAKRIEQYYIRHGKDKKKTYVHFMDEGISKKTVYHILRRHEQRGDVSFKKPTGRRVSVCTPEMFDNVANLFKNNPELSCREAAVKLGLARTTIFRILSKMREMNMETYKVIDSEPRCPTCHQKIDPKTTNLRPAKKIKKERRTEGTVGEGAQSNDGNSAITDNIPRVIKQSTEGSSTDRQAVITEFIQ